jgi:Tfp pilus assembly PilM family ATPase
LVSTPYPPFGLATISMFGLSSYLILVGIYSSAISVAADSELRHSIRKFAIKKSSLLDSIGSAEMEQEIENRVLDMTKQQQENMIRQTGLSSSLSEEEVRRYLDLVINEINKKDTPK